MRLSILSARLIENLTFDRLVFVHDPTDSGAHVIPVGKQTLQPSHIFYTSCSGIWQSVWIEWAPTDYITAVDISAGMDGRGMSSTQRHDGYPVLIFLMQLMLSSAALGATVGKCTSRSWIEVAEKWWAATTRPLMLRSHSWWIRQSYGHQTLPPYTMSRLPWMMTKLRAT